MVSPPFRKILYETLLYDKNGAVSENIEVVIPTVEQLESFFNRSVLSEFQKTRK